VLSGAEAAAARGAELIAEAAAEAIAERGTFTLAISGGRSPWRMYAGLDGLGMPWAQTEVFQVDERAVADDDPDRNWARARATLPMQSLAAAHPMPVTAADLDAAAASYEALLPDRIDLVHLGLGPDGHTASLVPGDPVLEVSDRRVAATGPYQGHRRMTLTYPGLATARRALWLVTGPDKREALAKLRAGSGEIPAGRVRAAAAIVVADSEAAPGG
jgi:6-phosphogluconolactonase